MSEDETIYWVQVDVPSGELLLQISGKRETVIEAALRVMTDHAPAWDRAAAFPQFRVTMKAIR